MMESEYYVSVAQGVCKLSKAQLTYNIILISCVQHSEISHLYTL